MWRRLHAHRQTDTQAHACARPPHGDDHRHMRDPSGGCGISAAAWYGTAALGGRLCLHARTHARVRPSYVLRSHPPLPSRTVNCASADSVLAPRSTYWQRWLSAFQSETAVDLTLCVVRAVPLTPVATVALYTRPAVGSEEWLFRWSWQAHADLLAWSGERGTCGAHRMAWKSLSMHLTPHPVCMRMATPVHTLSKDLSATLLQLPAPVQYMHT